MKLPNHERAIVAREKLTDYLLSLTPEDGRPKALFFIGVGFSIGQWESLASALRRHAAAHEVAVVGETVFGTRYVIEGILDTPVGMTPLVRAVWFIDSGRELPRLVTAYPIRRRAR